ncbi:hypothetical protein NKG05_00835 [Oerskovia sp. M15]
MVFQVDAIGSLEMYGERLRNVLSSAVRTVVELGIDGDCVDASRVPKWFAGHTDRGGFADIPVEALGGRRVYLDEREQSEWDLQEWLYCFEPDLRRWSWWDLTVGCDGRTLLLWVDTSGELVVPCDELWWAIFATGARGASASMGRASQDWDSRPSVGLGLDGPR